MKDAGNLGMKGIAIADIYHQEWETSKTGITAPCIHKVSNSVL